MIRDDFLAPLDWIKAQSVSLTDTVIQWSHINSGTYHQAGNALMHQVLIDAFSSLNAEQSSITPASFDDVSLQGVVERPLTGKILSLKQRACAPLQIILCGHMDTVFAKDSPFQHTRFIDDVTLNGPGVSDMKGGLLVMLTALNALERSPFADYVGYEVVINADEEIGSPASSAYLAEAALGKALGLVYEPTMTPSGCLASSRKGSGKFTLVATGKSAHAGRNFTAGRNAICFLAEAISRIDKLNGQRDGVTINIGLVAGGEALNAVPATAACKIDVRIVSAADSDWVLAKLQSVIDTASNQQGFELTLHGGFGRQPKPFTKTTKQLFNKVQSVGRHLGLSIDWQPSGGCCDGNNLSACGIPVVDTLGVRGGNIHQDSEYILLDSLVERAQLSALLLMTLAYEQSQKELQ